MGQFILASFAGIVQEQPRVLFLVECVTRTLTSFLDLLALLRLLDGLGSNALGFNFLRALGVVLIEKPLGFILITYCIALSAKA